MRLAAPAPLGPEVGMKFAAEQPAAGRGLTRRGCRPNDREGSPRSGPMTAGTAQEKGTVHAVLINSTDQTITDVDIEPTLEAYYELIGCHTVEVGERFPNGDVLFYVDEEGMINGTKTFFRMSDTGRIFAGNGLIVGTIRDEEEGIVDTDAKTKAPFITAWFAADVEEAA